MANRDPLLTFEEFSVPDKNVCNNLYLHFYGEQGEFDICDGYREKFAFTECMKHYPEEFASLWKKLDEVHASQTDKKKRVFLRDPEYLKLLYGAYVLMHPFAESNYELFR